MGSKPEDQLSRIATRLHFERKLQIRALFDFVPGRPAMQYDASTPEEYLAQLEEDWRRTSLLQIRRIILAEAPEIEEGIHYKMLGYALDGAFVFHLNAQRNYVSLYAGDTSRIDPEGVFLKGLSVGKGCIRFTKTKSVPESRIGDFIERAILLKRQGADFSC